MKYKFIEWLKAAGVRALKTCAQTALATIGTAAAFDQVDWKMAGMASLLAAILSLLTSIAGLPELDLNPAAQIRQETEPPEPMQ